MRDFKKYLIFLENDCYIDLILQKIPIVFFPPPILDNFSGIFGILKRFFLGLLQFQHYA